MRSIRNIILSLKKYGFLIKQLVSRDFKVKYKRSVLGVAWSLLYPVLMMSVMAIIFSNVFKFSVPGVNYLVYLLTGLTYFNYFSEASNLSMSSIIANFGLINKVYIPKYIFPLTKCLFVGISFLASFTASCLPLIKNLSEGTRTIILTVVIAGLAAALFPVEEETEAQNEA